MSYVDAIHNRDQDLIHVVERVEGRRVYTDFPARYLFYFDDVKGKYRTIYDTPVSRFVTRNGKEFQKELRAHNHLRTWESDVSPVFRCLEENYRHRPAPVLHTAFFDIETDFDPKRGFSSPNDPFTAITAITVYLDWTQQLVTLSLPPRGLKMDQAEALVSEFENTFLFDDEAAMLNSFLDLIADADVLSGWNSTGYDIPYTVNRICQVLSKDDTRRLCLWEQMPKYRTFEKYGTEQSTYDLIGRLHLDYMDLYRKYTYEERHSYSLDAISEYELGEHKTPYEGTLDQLYNNDYRKFIEYNRQDVMLIARLDQKLRFIDLANELAHDNTVLIPTTMGAVAVTEQAIINEAHDRGLIVPDKKHRPRDTEDNDQEEDEGAAGAYVAYPKKGLHDSIGAIDLNSLYPNTIRALNMGPETIVGQIRLSQTEAYIADKRSRGLSFAAAWEGLFGTLEYTAVINQDPAYMITVDWENGTSTDMSAAELHQLIWAENRPWMLTANGTILTSEREGIVPGLLRRWYSERKDLQKKKKEATTKEDQAFWDKRQLVKKINLNSLYGAVLNPYCRFNDKRIGQSTTLSGRVIARHMNAYVNQCVTGDYNHTGDAIIYADTDSCYFSAWPTIKNEVAAGTMEWNRDLCVGLYDAIADQVNDSFPGFCAGAFHTPRSNGELIRCGRELVASKGLYITKKRYAVLIYDLEGKRLDQEGVPGKLKAMGLDLKRADTPKVVQQFLSSILMEVLQGAEKQQIIDRVKEFKQQFQARPAWEKGTPKRVNNLTRYRELEAAKGKSTIPGHVRAALNWNTLKQINADRYSLDIVDGMKVVVCKLLPNPAGFTSVAYPIDELRLPAWFKELPFDQGLMEETIVDTKVDNLLGVLDWDLQNQTSASNEIFSSLFTFN
jgi:DNA polymerase elongation subunit (family B)